MGRGECPKSPLLGSLDATALFVDGEALDQRSVDRLDLGNVGFVAPLFDLADPERCLLRGENWVFGPREHYELVGDVGGVVFLNGCTLQDDGDTLHLYYGGADKCVALATASVREMLAWIKENGQPDAAIDVWF